MWMFTFLGAVVAICLLVVIANELIERFAEPVVNVVRGILRIIAYPIIWLTNGKAVAEDIRKEHKPWVLD